jgi:hypothetical protein
MPFTDNDFPALLGAELYRPVPQYIVKAVTQPQVLHDFNAQPGASVQLDRYSYWGDNGSLTRKARSRGETETIGTGNSRNIPKRKVNLILEEFTGPAAMDDPDAPANLTITEQQIMKARRMLLDRNIQGFHQSIGSLTLLDDFRRWEDRVYSEILLESPNTYNPGNVPDGGVYPQGPPKFDVKNDLVEIVRRLQSDNVPTFQDGNYGAIVSPHFLKHLRQDDDFRMVARYPGQIPMSMMNQPYTAGPAQIPYLDNPNALLFGGANMGQSFSANGMPGLMPTGFVFEGVRFFLSNNLTTENVNLTYTASVNAIKHPIGPASREAHLGIFFGPMAIGVGVGGIGPEVLMNKNDDYGRFKMSIWRMFGAFTLLNENFVQVARTYGD